MRILYSHRFFIILYKTDKNMSEYVKNISVFAYFHSKGNVIFLIAAILRNCIHETR